MFWKSRWLHRLRSRSRSARLTRAGRYEALAAEAGGHWVRPSLYPEPQAHAGQSSSSSTSAIAPSSVHPALVSHAGGRWKCAVALSPMWMKPRRAVAEHSSSSYVPLALPPEMPLQSWSTSANAVADGSRRPAYTDASRSLQSAPRQCEPRSPRFAVVAKASWSESSKGRCRSVKCSMMHVMLRWVHGAGRLLPTPCGTKRARSTLSTLASPKKPAEAAGTAIWKALRRAPLAGAVLRESLRRRVFAGSRFGAGGRFPGGQPGEVQRAQWVGQRPMRAQISSGDSAPELISAAAASAAVMHCLSCSSHRSAPSCFGSSPSERRRPHAAQVVSPIGVAELRAQVTSRSVSPPSRRGVCVRR